MNKNIKILAIETSCDETAAAVIEVVENQPKIISSIVSSQIDLHAKTGGVVPEVASRAHIESILPVIASALLEQKAKSEKPKADFDALSPEPSALSYSEAIKELQNIDYIAVTAGPGLVGSLLIGFNAAKSLAYALDKPVVAVNHIEGHIYSAFSGINQGQVASSKGQEISALDPRPLFPLLALTVSGGHTSLTLMKDHGNYENLGQTLDDAAGEAFDKVAKLLELGYPGGPIVSKYAARFRESYQLSVISSQSIPNDQLLNDKLIENCPQGHLKGEKLSSTLREEPSGSDSNEKIENSPKELVFPRPIMNDGTFNFSFSGLKTAVLQYVLNTKKNLYFSSHPELVSGSHNTEMLKQVQHDINKMVIPDETKAEICAAFEDAVVDVLTTKAMRAVEKYKPKALILAGGVAANRHLREILKTKVDQYPDQLDLLIPPINLCGDNAAMIGVAAYYNIYKNNISSWDKIKVDSNLELS